jgi:2,3-bisphosphoglycerate-independent phosphoglycerate mutase
MIWLFWGSGEIPEMPPFQQVFGVDASLTSGVDLLKGLAIMSNITVLDIKGVTDAFDNDYAAQMEGALKSLNKHDLVIIHVEAPDEAGHSGSVEKKIEAIEKIDKYMVNQIISYGKNKIRVLIMPDHPTPIEVLTHTPDPVPFMIWGNGIRSNGVKRFTENEAKSTGLFIKSGHTVMHNLVK